MTNRERLIEILKNEPCPSPMGCVQTCKYSTQDPCFEARYADLLLEHGVIVLPCKVGDTIYRRGDPIKKIYEWEVEHIEIYADEIVFVDDSDNEFTISDIGKTVFLSLEDAEKEE